MQYLTKRKLSALKQENLIFYDKSFPWTKWLSTKKYNNKSIKDVKNNSAITPSPLFHVREGGGGGGVSTYLKETKSRKLPGRSKEGSVEEISLTEEEENNTRDTQHWIISRSSEVWKEAGEGTASLTPHHHLSFPIHHDHETTSANSILKTLHTCKSNRKVRSTEESVISKKRNFLEIVPREKSFLLKGLLGLHPFKRRRSLVNPYKKSLKHILSPYHHSLSSTKMDHEDLMAELPQIEKLSNQERLRLAHKRRMLQLKRFQQ
jgi:hypothetical protein